MMKSLLMILVASTAVAGPSNKEMKIGITQEFETLNPIIMTMVSTVYMFGFTGRALVTLNADLKWIPNLAKSVPSLENGGAKLTTVDGKKTLVAVWEIVDNAKWGDGHPLTCEDFAFSREIAGSDFVSVGERESWTQVAKIDWDPKTPRKCIFTYDKPRWDFFRLAQFYPLPKHVEGPIWKKYGSQKEGYEKNTNYTRNPTNPALYSGPYVVSEVKLGDHISFSRNPQFYGEPAKIERLIVKFIGNTGTLEANLRSGTIDMISILGFDLDQAISFEKKVKAEHLPYSVQYVSGFQYEHIDLNLDNPILKDLRVRRALMMSVNRTDLVKALFEGKQEVASVFISPKDPWYSTDPKVITSYPYSKRGAQKLLGDAGWDPGADGYRYKNGKKLSITFMTTAGNKTRELVQTYLQEQWKAVGIEILIKNEPAKVFFGETARKRLCDGMTMYAWQASPENTPRSQLSSESIPNDKNGWSGQNFPGWKNPLVDKAMLALDTEFDAKKRLEEVWEAERQYTAEIPVLPMYYRSDISVPPKGLKNYRMTGHQFYETNESEKWTF